MKFNKKNQKEAICDQEENENVPAEGETEAPQEETPKKRISKRTWMFVGGAVGMAALGGIAAALKKKFFGVSDEEFEDEPDDEDEDESEDEDDDDSEDDESED